MTVEFIWKYKSLTMAKTILKNRNKFGGVTLLKLSIKSHQSKQCDAGLRMDLYVTGVELMVQK